MGRRENDKLYSSQILYPIMQCADIFELTYNGNHINICQLGNDQRKVNMLAIEYANIINTDTSASSNAMLQRPIICSHHMISGLRGRGKMSKSGNDAIFMNDTADDIRKKLNSAFCPDTIDDNPVFEYIKYLLLPYFIGIAKYEHINLCGTNYDNITAIVNDFAEMNKKILKQDIAKYIIELCCV